MNTHLKNVLRAPGRDLVLIGLITLAFIADYAGLDDLWLLTVAGIAVIPTFISALEGAKLRRINIDTFNAFAVVVSYATGEAHSAGFIALMLTFARLLDWRTESRTRDAVEELMRLKPLVALVEKNGVIVESPADAVQNGDIVVVKSGGRIPVDGVIVHGTAHINEASVTGESRPVEKMRGDQAISATLVEDGAIKIRATGVGKDSTIERMATMMRDASAHKSHSEKLADRFAAIFLPVVATLGILTYLITRDISMTAALFLIACADDMAVAIPLAMTASLGLAAKHGVIIKGGEYLDVLARMNILVLDKTGTLTFGRLTMKQARLEPGVDENKFWTAVALAEKFSEHPVGRAAYREAVHRVGEVPDPDKFEVHKGSGVTVHHGNDDIIAGTGRLFASCGLAVPETVVDATGSTFWIAMNGKLLGSIEVADEPRPEAQETLRKLRALGVKRIIMFTGDNELVAAEVSRTLGIDEYRSAMTPESKLRELELLLAEGPVGMVGDGINDAPALARADVGIAMGGGGAAVSVEAADIVIMTDDIARLPQMIELGRRTFGVVRGDIVIWAISNLAGFTLVFTGIAGPALAAFYNFATDFFPLINSSRLFKDPKKPT